jgi:hypothetical protein
LIADSALAASISAGRTARCDKPDFYFNPRTFMLVLGLLSLIIGGGNARLSSSMSGAALVTSDTIRTVTDSTPVRDSALARLRLSPALPDSQGRPRPKAVEMSDWYSRRLTIHRYVAYATIPVFALQYAAGEKLYNKSKAAPTWAKTMHRVGATSLAGMFTVNTVTGAWNWWDSRSAAQGRVLRTVHALTMLAADGAFTYAGAKLSNEAENSAAKRKEHRTIALSAMGVTIVSGVAMKLWNR